MRCHSEVNNMTMRTKFTWKLYVSKYSKISASDDDDDDWQ